MANMRIKQTQHQKMVLNHAQQTNIDILTLNHSGIISYLISEAQENPALDPDNLSKEISRITTDNELSESVSYITDYKIEKNDKLDSGDENYIDWNLSINSTNEKTFLENLLDQARESGVSGELRMTVETLILSLNQQGYLEKSIFNKIIQKTKILKEARSILMNFEPKGSGSFSTSEYIAFQLQEKGEISEPIIEFIKENLEDIFLKSTYMVKERLPIGSPSIEELRKIIRELNPYPSYGYYEGERVTYLRPDAKVDIDGQDIKVLINSDLIPEIKINENYLKIIESADSEDRKLLNDYLSRVRYIAEAIRRRNITLRRVIEEICKVQRKFLIGESPPIDIIQKDIARRIGMSESTVSRAVKDKYIEINGRILPLAVFFRNTRSEVNSVLSENETLTDNHRRIKEIIENENPSKPISDGKIADILKEKGFIIPRRTVAKFRTDLGIPIYTARKKLQ